MAHAPAAPGWAARNEQYEQVYFDPDDLPSESANAVAFQSDSESDYPSDEDGQGGSHVAPQRPRRPSNGGDDDDEMAAAESERMPVFGLESRGAAAAFEHAAGLQRLRHILAAPVSDRTLPAPAQWFHGIVSRDQAEKLLYGNTTGTFLIRISESRLGYSLSLVQAGIFRHYKIEELDDSYRLENVPASFQSLRELVENYRENDVSVNADRCLTALDLAAPVSDRTLPRSQNDGGGGGAASETLVGIFERNAVDPRFRDDNDSFGLYAQLADLSRVSGCQHASPCRSGHCAAPQPVLLATGDANEVDPTCNICFSVSVSRQLPCGHRLCESCVCRWRTTGHNTCPFCRARIDPARVKEVGVLEYPGRVPMDPVGEAFMRFVAHKVAVPSDRPRSKPRGGRSITVTEKAGVVIEPDWDNLAGIFPDRAIPLAPRKHTALQPYCQPSFRSGDADLATTTKIAEDTKSETETQGGSDGIGPTDTVYDCATASEEVRGEDDRPPADREARARGSIARGSLMTSAGGRRPTPLYATPPAYVDEGMDTQTVSALRPGDDGVAVQRPARQTSAANLYAQASPAGSSRRAKHSRPRMRRSSGTSDLSCEHGDRCSPEAAAEHISAPSANGDDGNEATEQDGAGSPEPLGNVSVARAYDALVGRRWDQLLQVINPAKQPPSPQVTARRGATEPELHSLGPDDV